MYDYTCSKCGGLVPEPMKAYGYVGKYCHCPNPEKSLYEVKVVSTDPEKDTCDKHNKPDCMSCFYTTRAEATETWQTRFDDKFGMFSNYADFCPSGDEYKDFIRREIEKAKVEERKKIKEDYKRFLRGLKSEQTWETWRKEAEVEDMATWD